MMKKISRVLILSWIIAIPLIAAADNGRRDERDRDKDDSGSFHVQLLPLDSL
jgi:hypothetical protein